MNNNEDNKYEYNEDCMCYVVDIPSKVYDVHEEEIDNLFERYESTLNDIDGRIIVMSFQRSSGVNFKISCPLDLFEDYCDLICLEVEGLMDRLKDINEHITGEWR